LAEDAIECRSGRKVDRVAWHEIRQFRITEDASGQPARVQLSTMTRAMNLADLEEMPRLTETLRQHIAVAPVMVQTPKPAASARATILGFGGAVFVWVLLQVLPERVAGLFVGAGLLCTGLWLVLLRPLSTRSGVIFRHVEFLLGSWLIFIVLIWATLP